MGERMMKISRLFAVSAVAALVAVALPVHFATAQEESPPAWKDTICQVVHVQNGGTPGLYGLCTAYCEEQCKVGDADLEACQVENPDPFQVKGCTCARILANYDNKKLETDPPMPCVLDECPCYDEAFLTTELAAKPAFCNDDTNAVREQTLLDARDAGNCNAFANSIKRFDAAGNPVSASCAAFDRDRNPANNLCEPVLNTFQEVSLEQFEICQALVRAQAAIVGVPCN
jgi:hypothetical protein